MKKLLFFVCCSFILQVGFSQEKETKKEETISLNADKSESSELPTPVSFAIIEKAPIYSGCESYETNVMRKRCMQTNIRKHVGKNFNNDVLKQIKNPESSRIRAYATFTISKEGDLKDINVRTKHEVLKTEIKRVLSLIPKFTPGTQRGKNVNVRYTLPLQFATISSNDKGGNKKS